MQLQVIQGGNQWFRGVGASSDSLGIGLWLDEIWRIIDWVVLCWYSWKDWQKMSIWYLCRQVVINKGYTL